MFDDRLPPFEAHGGILEPFDDGHVPETFRCSSSANDNNKDDNCNRNDENVPRIVRYPLHHSDSPSVRIYDDALPTALLDRLYECTVHPLAGAENNDARCTSSAPPKPWGTYVTIQEAVEWMQRFDGKGCQMEDMLSTEELSSHNLDEHRHHLAVAVIALLLIGRKDEASAIVPVDGSDNPPCLLNDLANPSTALKSDAHGVAVWALSSTVGSEVRYHIDYAEQYRYERNITVPPLLAGTVQCTNFGGEYGNTGGMVGGDFAVNLGGLKHYETNGYKGARSGDDRGGWIDPALNNANANDDDINSSCSSVPYHDELSDWVTVPYRYNRAIFHHGQLTHLSTPIKSIPPSGDEGANNNRRSKSRVILGMNVFGHDIGPDVSKAPEHSDAFRRKIKMYRALLSKPSGNGNGDGTKRTPMHNHKLSVEAVRKNKALSKLLVLAKREKIKQDLRKRQAQLSDDILAALDAAESTSDISPPLTVGELMERLGKPSKESNWPTSTDVHVHLHHLVMGNGERIVNRGGRIEINEKKIGKDGLISLSTELSMRNTAE